MEEWIKQARNRICELGFPAFAKNEDLYPKKCESKKEVFDLVKLYGLGFVTVIEGSDFAIVIGTLGIPTIEGYYCGPESKRWEIADAYLDYMRSACSWGL